MNEFETHIPWDFLGLLLIIGIAAIAIVCCALVLKARRRARLTNPRKDHVYKTH